MPKLRRIPVRMPTVVIGGLVAVLAITGAVIAPVPRVPADATETDPPVEPPRLYVRSGDGATILEPEFRSNPADIARSGLFGPRTPITISNLTVSSGEYVISYTFETRQQTVRPATELRCGIADANGSGALLIEGSAIPLRAAWQRAGHATRFGLPEMTISLRCFPSELGVSVTSFRSIELTVTRLP